MIDLLLPILVAASVATFAWVGVAAIAGATGGQRRRLQQRLTVDNRPDGSPAASGALSITIQLEVTGVPAFLARRPFIQRLHRHLLQAYPDRTLVRFLARAATYALVFGGITLLVTTSVPVGLAAGAAGWYL